MNMSHGSPAVGMGINPRQPRTRGEGPGGLCENPHTSMVFYPSRVEGGPRVTRSCDPPGVLLARLYAGLGGLTVG